jgi:hypothetical protein
VAKKAIRVTRPRSFHLRGKKDHYPTVNLAGTEEHKQNKIDFDKQKVAWARSYVDALEKLAIDPSMEAALQAALQKTKDPLAQWTLSYLANNRDWSDLDPAQLEGELLKSTKLYMSDPNMKSWAQNRMESDTRAAEGHGGLANTRARDLSNEINQEHVLRRSGYQPAADQAHLQGSSPSAENATIAGRLTDAPVTAIGAGLANMIPGVGRFAGLARGAINAAASNVTPIVAARLPNRNSSELQPEDAASLQSNSRLAELQANYQKMVAEHGPDSPEAQSVGQELKSFHATQPQNVVGNDTARREILSLSQVPSNVASSIPYRLNPKGFGAWGTTAATMLPLAADTWEGLKNHDFSKPERQLALLNDANNSASMVGQFMGTGEFLRRLSPTGMTTESLSPSGNLLQRGLRGTVNSLKLPWSGLTNPINANISRTLPGRLIGPVAPAVTGAGKAVNALRNTAIIGTLASGAQSLGELGSMAINGTDPVRDEQWRRVYNRVLETEGQPTGVGRTLWSGVAPFLGVGTESAKAVTGADQGRRDATGQGALLGRYGTANEGSNNADAYRAAMRTIAINQAQEAGYQQMMKMLEQHPVYRYLPEDRKAEYAKQRAEIAARQTLDQLGIESGSPVYGDQVHKAVEGLTKVPTYDVQKATRQDWDNSVEQALNYRDQHFGTDLVRDPEGAVGKQLYESFHPATQEEATKAGGPIQDYLWGKYDRTGRVPNYTWAPDKPAKPATPVAPQAPKPALAPVQAGHPATAPVKPVQPIGTPNVHP